MEQAIALIAALLGGAGVGYLVRQMIATSRAQTAESRAQKILLAPQREARQDSRCRAREQLEKQFEVHRRKLEAVAGMTALEAREALTAEIVNEAKRSAM